MKTRKVILSFIGTGNYTPCIYKSEIHVKTSSNVKFIQTAVAQMFEFDKYYIFETQKAKETHHEGLIAELNLLVDKVEFINILEAQNEKDIWKIFTNIINVIDENDDIVLDITHAFRYFPMLGMVLLDFLKTTKNIKVNDIVYGAFEQKQTIQNEFIAPLLHLKSFSDLQDWTRAARNYKEYGVFSGLNLLSTFENKKTLKETQGKDKSAKMIERVSKDMEILSNNILYNRSQELNEFNFSELQKNLEQLNEIGISIAPLKTLINLFKNKVATFSSNYVWLDSAKWCLTHDLIQQGFTQLQEGIISDLVIRYRNELCDLHVENLNKMELEKRNFVSSFINVINANTEKEKWSKLLSENINICDKIKPDTKLCQLYSEITNYRNNINHAGYENSSQTPKKLKEKLKEFINRIEEILKFNL